MRPWYEPRKNRPDIPKNAKRKKGVVGFLEIFWREFFSLIGLNLLFLVTCIPIVTIPAALTAMNRITATMVQDKTHFLFVDYFRAFKRDFGKSLLGGVIILVMIAVFAFSTWFYFSMGIENSKLFLLLTAVSCCLLAMAVLCGIYFFSMLAIVELDFRSLFKNSFAMIGHSLKNSLIALFHVLIFGVLLGVGLFPYSVVYALFIMFALVNLLTSYVAVPAIEKHVLQIPEMKEEEEEEDPNSSEFGDFPELEAADVGEFPEFPELPEEEENNQEEI